VNEDGPVGAESDAEYDRGVDVGCGGWVLRNGIT
jgi:hypothetical protein